MAGMEKPASQAITAALSLALASTCLWGVLHLIVFPYFYLGFLGTLLLAWITGPSGGTTTEIVIGSTLFLLINTIVYYAILQLAIRLLRLI